MRGKIVLIIFLCIFSYFTLYSNDNCYFSGGACVETTKYDEIEVYPNCYVYVRYMLIECPGNPLQINFLGYGFNFSSPNPCLPLYSNLFPLYPNRNITDDIVWENIETFIKETILNKEINIMANASPNGKDDFLCGQNSFVLLQMKNVVCEAVCMRDAKIVTDPVTGNPILPADMNMINVDPTDPIIIVQKVACTHVCCIVERSYCYNKVLVNGQYEYILQYTETKTATEEYFGCQIANPDECVIPSYLTDYTYPGLSSPWYYVGDCYDTCVED